MSALFYKRFVYRSVYILLALLFILGLWYGASFFFKSPSFQQVRAEYLSSYVEIQDQNGLPLGRVRKDFQVRKLEWLALADYSPALVQAVLLSEDKRFYQHWGVDYLALGSAVWNTLSGQAIRGASTITMQLAGMIEPDLQRHSQRRSYRQKILQMQYAHNIEHDWSKSEILEAYLNLLPLRGEIVGIGAASRAFFQKYPKYLSQRDAAILAAMLRSPNVDINTLAKRSCVLYKQLDSSADCRYLASHIQYALQNQSMQMAEDPDEAPHLAYMALTKMKAKGLTIPDQLRTTLVEPIQRLVIRSVTLRLKDLFKNRVQDAAVVVMENSSGRILAYVGSAGAASSAQYVDHAQALRQAGSTLKPFLYALAIDQKRLTAASLLDDSLVNLVVDNGSLYVPQNYDKGFKGWVSVRTALASSLNIPAVRVLVMIGVESFRNLLVNLGLPLSESGDYYGYSLALGSADVNLLSLTNAYRALANHGVYSEYSLFSNDSPSPAVQVFSPQSSWIISHILSDRHARALTFGLDSPLSTPFWSAVKTGTSKDMRDNWTVGYSPFYTVGVWVGNSAGDSMRDISGVSGAGPIWQDVMSFLHQNRVSLLPIRPAGVLERQIKFEGNLESERKEYFMSGTEMSEIRMARSLDLQSAAHLYIDNPTNGTILALDPDIPYSQQRLILRAKQLGGKVEQALSWQIDGQLVGEGNDYAWYPLPGNHTISLLNSRGQLVETVHIQVRGAYLTKP